MSEHTDIVVNNKINNEEKIAKLKEVIDFNAYTIEKALSKPIHMLKKDDIALAKIEKQMEEKRNKLENIENTIIDSINI